MRRRIYSELLPLAELGRDETLRALATHGLELVVAIWPHTVEETLAIVARAQALGIKVTIWPMLSDEDGRWANLGNLPAFETFVRALVERSAGLCTELLIDLEPPIAKMRDLLGGEWRRFDKQASRREFALGKQRLHALLTWLRARGVKTTAAVIPLVVYDRPGRAGWQWLLGTPVDGLPFDTIHVMAYTTLFEGYTRGVLGRKDALVLLEELATTAVEKYGERAGISIGCTGAGALGDEQAYRDMFELEEDLLRVSAARDIALFDLRGVWKRPSRDAWLERFAATERLPQASLPSRGTSRRARMLAWLFAQRLGWLDEAMEELVEAELDDGA